MNSLGAIVVTVLIAIVLFARKRWALVGMMAGVLYLTEQQAIVVLGLNVTPMRLLEVIGIARVTVRREFSISNVNMIDRGVLMFYGYTTLVFLMRSSVGQAETVGSMVDATFCYFTFRGLIRNVDELKWFLRVFVIVLAPYVALLSIEMLTRENPFGLLGARTWNFELRSGRIRCMGSFRHPALLGTLGACLLPLYIGLVLTKHNRIRAFGGIGLCLGIVFLSNSGGPLSGAAMGVVGWLFWIARTKMFIVRRILAGTFVLLALVMKAPIWYLPARVSLLSGGGGWHRSYLLDMAFQHLGLWWFAGMGIDETRDWFVYALEATGAADITNNYLAFGFKAGLLAIALFIVLLIRAFRALGQGLAVVRHTVPRPMETEYLLWGLGCALLVHIVTWFGITYFDQIYVVWLMQLAAISCISQACGEGNGKRQGMMWKEQVHKRELRGVVKQ